MTTLMYDPSDHSVYADSQITADGLVISKSREKIFVVPYNDQQCLLAVTGDTDYTDKMVAELRAGRQPKDIKESCFGYLITPDGKVAEVYAPDLYFNLRDGVECMTNGSGRTVAFTAMRCGLHPVEAMELACELDAYTGGPIQHGRFDNNGTPIIESI